MSVAHPPSATTVPRRAQPASHPAAALPSGALAPLALQLGGRLTYFGPLGEESSALIAYLQAVPGVDPIRPGYNPAAWMLEVGDSRAVAGGAGCEWGGWLVKHCRMAAAGWVVAACCTWALLHAAAAAVVGRRRL